MPKNSSKPKFWTRSKSQIAPDDAAAAVGPILNKKLENTDKTIAPKAAPEAEVAPEAVPEVARESAPESPRKVAPESPPKVPEVPESARKVPPESSRKVAPEAVPESAPEVAPESAPKVAPEAVPESAPEVAPEAVPESAPEVAPESAPEVAPEAVLESAPEVDPESAPEVAPEDATELGLIRIIQKQKLENTDENTVLGVFIQGFELQYKSGSPYHKGTITFQSGSTKDVSFIALDIASGIVINDIYTRNTIICDERVLIPLFVMYCEDISKYIICYDRFHCSLNDWLPRWFNFNSVKDAYGLPHSDIKTEISKMLNAVNNIHRRGLLHLSLSDISSYVVIDNKWYIINIRGSLEKSDPKSKSKVISDFCDFRDMLKNYVLLHPSWPEREYFFNTFARTNISPNRLVPILLDHVFTKSSRDRLQMFSEIYHGWMDHNRNCSMLFNAIRNGLFDQYTNGGWDKDRVHMGYVLSEIYNHSYYDGHKITSLMKFCRNVYEHYYQYGGNVNLIEKEVRQLWPGFLEKLLHYY